MTDQEFEALKEECRQQRLRGLARHWSYQVAEHSYLFRKYLHEKARRDTIEIDAAMGRFQEILEAAE
jgi:hypothetical protein